jgi:hypothetical protein
MTRKCIGLFFVFLVVLASASAEVMSKSRLYPGTRNIKKCVYYENNSEIAVDYYDHQRHLTKREGRIPDGVVKSYHRNGRVLSEVTFKDNMWNGVARVYNEKGVLRKEINFQNDKKQGPAKVYYSNGLIAKALNFRDNVLQGKCTTYNVQGGIRGVVCYENGKRMRGGFNKSQIGTEDMAALQVEKPQPYRISWRLIVGSSAVLLGIVIGVFFLKRKWS